MDSTTEPQSAYVFGYGSLVAMRGSLQTAGDLLAPVPGRLHGFRRLWGVAMDNWEAAPLQKHFVDPATRQPPRIRVAFLDVEEGPEGVVNGLAVPVDAARLDEMDEREVNYSRVDVSSSFEPRVPYRVYAYRGSEEARARCRVRDVDASIYVSRDYLVGVRRAFASLGPASLAEFERTTAPLSFPLRSLELVQPGSSAVDASGA